MAAFETDARTTHPIDYRLHGTPLLYLRRTYFEDDADALAHDGYQVTRIDAAGWHSARDAHGSIAASLDFPGYYGHNLDALNDCLGDVAAYDYGVDPLATGTAILLDNAAGFANENISDFVRVVDVFAGAILTAMTFGHRMLMLILVDNPNLTVPLSGGVAGWNPRERFDTNRIH